MTLLDIRLTNSNTIPLDGLAVSCGEHTVTSASPPDLGPVSACKGICQG